MPLHPSAAFSFSVRVAGSGADVGPVFQEVSGLDVERNPNALKAGGENRFVHRLPGLQKASKLLLKRGIVPTGSLLFTWCKEVLESDLSTPIRTRAVTVSLIDAQQKPMISWSLINAWPVTWSVGALHADGKEVVVETIGLAYGQITREVIQLQQTPNLSS